MTTATNDTTFDLAELLWGDPPPKPRKVRKPRKQVGISKDVARIIWATTAPTASLRNAAKGGAR